MVARGMEARTISTWACRMRKLDGGKVGARRLLALQGLKRARTVERVVDGAQAIGPLGMAVACVVLEAGGVGEEEGGHERATVGPDRSWVSDSQVLLERPSQVRPP